MTIARPVSFDPRDSRPSAPADSRSIMVRCVPWMAGLAVLLLAACARPAAREVRRPPFTLHPDFGEVTALRDGRAVTYRQLGRLILRTGLVSIDDVVYLDFDATQELTIRTGVATVFELVDEMDNIVGIEVRSGNIAYIGDDGWIVQAEMPKGLRGTFGLWDAFDTRRVAIFDRFYRADIDRLSDRLDAEDGDWEGMYDWSADGRPREFAEELGLGINTEPAQVLLSNMPVIGGEFFVQKDPDGAAVRLLFVYVP